VVTYVTVWHAIEVPEPAVDMCMGPRLAVIGARIYLKKAVWKSLLPLEWWLCRLETMVCTRLQGIRQFPTYTKQVLLLPATRQHQHAQALPDANAQHSSNCQATTQAVHNG
jgi:hypothetical protein